MKDARYHAFHILKIYYQKKDRLKTVRDNYFKNHEVIRIEPWIKYATEIDRDGNIYLNIDIPNGIIILFS